jgi:hypothetical protein
MEKALGSTPSINTEAKQKASNLTILKQEPFENGI